MFNRIVLATLICCIALSVSLTGFLLDDTNQNINAESDSAFAARFDFARTAILADPDCPLPTSGTGGGC